MEEWVFKSPVKNSRNGLNLFIDASKTNQSSVKVQFPKCRCPFGIQEKKADATEFSRRNLELSADDEAMQKWVAAFDDLNCRKAAENSEEWFRKKLSKEALGELYRQCLQVSTKDPDKYAPLVRVKVSETGKNPTNIFVVYKDGQTEKYKRGSVADLNRNCYVVPQFEVSGLWYAQPPPPPRPHPLPMRRTDPPAAPAGSSPRASARRWCAPTCWSGPPRRRRSSASSALAV